MSGICDTCSLSKGCRKPIGGVDSCRRYVRAKESNYEWFFGTPEKAARTLAMMCDMSLECDFCLLHGRSKNICGNGDYDALLEWLMGGDAE